MFKSTILTHGYSIGIQNLTKQFGFWFCISAALASAGLFTKERLLFFNGSYSYSKMTSVSHNSYNSLEGLEAVLRKPLNKHMKSILEFLHSQEIPLSAQEIAEKTKLNHSSCRSCLRQLLAKDLVVQPYYGHYIAKQKLTDQLQNENESRMGMVKVNGSLLPRVHNVRLKVEGVKKGMLDVRGSWDWQLGDVKITFVNCGGDVVTVTIAYDEGLDYDRWSDVRDFVLIELGLGLQPVTWERVWVTSAELGNDFEGFRIDGAQAWTLTAFDGTFERYYNKKNGVRHEVKMTKPATLAEMEALLKGGVSRYSVTRSQIETERKLESLTEAVKGGNRMIAESSGSFRQVTEQLLQKFDSSTEKIGHIADDFAKSMNEHLAIIRVFKKESEDRSLAYNQSVDRLVPIILKLEETLTINSKSTLTLSSILNKRQQRRQPVTKKKHGLFHSLRKRLKL